MVIEEKFYIAKCDKCGKLYEDVNNGVIFWKPTPEDALEAATGFPEGFHNVCLKDDATKRKYLLCDDCYNRMTDDEGWLKPEFVDDEGNIKTESEDGK